MTQADTPQDINNICFVLLHEKFEKFWSTYPQHQNKPKAWEAFQKLNPDDDLFASLMTALLAQVNHHQHSQQAGHWIPSWKYPANWILQQSWNDELITYTTLETSYAKHQRPPEKKSTFDVLWESCKDGADYELSNEVRQPSTTTNNVITFPRGRMHG